jgi:hypothetical protein
LTQNNVEAGKLFVLCMYYGGGMQSFGEQLKLTTFFNGWVDEAELRAALATLNDKEDEDEYENEEVDEEVVNDYVRDALQWMDDNKTEAGMAHEVSDSFYIVGRSIDAVLAELKTEFALEEHNFATLAANVREGNADDMDFIDKGLEDGGE